MGGGDPSQFWNFIAPGKEVLNRSEITDPRMQRMFDGMAQRLGVTNGQITKQQFIEMSQQRMAGRNQGGGAGPGAAPAVAPPGQGGPGAPGGGGDDWIVAMFRKLDANSDNYLNDDEMPPELRADKAHYDTNHDGLIDLNEFKEYMRIRMQVMQAANQGGYGGGNGQPTEDEEESKPVVHRHGSFPKELPAWFAEMDTDKDAQIGLYEWKASGRSLDEFMKMDRNGDGFLTVDEVLRYQALTKAKSGAPSGPGGPGGGFPGGGGSLPMAGGPGGGGGGFPGAGFPGGNGATAFQTENNVTPSQPAMPQASPTEGRGPGDGQGRNRGGNGNGGNGNGGQGRRQRGGGGQRPQ
jgi:Ca2+-binding EF-hand superfamily protein